MSCALYNTGFVLLCSLKRLVNNDILFIKQRKKMYYYVPWAPTVIGARARHYSQQRSAVRSTAKCNKKQKKKKIAIFYAYFKKSVCYYSLLKDN